MTDYPIVGLDINQSAFFRINPPVRQLVGNVMSKRYGDCLIVDEAGYCLARVFANAQVKMAEMPYVRYPMWQIVNKPSPADCACAEYYDMEVEGEWRNRDLARHHPMCIYDRTSQLNHQFHARGGIQGIKRPDTWTLKREELEGSTGITSLRRG